MKVWVVTRWGGLATRMGSEPAYHQSLHCPRSMHLMKWKWYWGGALKFEWKEEHNNVIYVFNQWKPIKILWAYYGVTLCPLPGKVYHPLQDSSIKTANLKKFQRVCWKLFIHYVKYHNEWGKSQRGFQRPPPPRPISRKFKVGVMMAHSFPFQ